MRHVHTLYHWAVLGAILVGLGHPALARAEFMFGGHTYDISAAGATWSSARTAAAATSRYGQPGYLAVIESQEENTAIYDALILASVATTAADGGGARYAWLGGSDSGTAIPGASEGNFFWLVGGQFWQGGESGSPFGGSYANWGQGTLNNEPDNYYYSGQYQNYLAMGLQDWPTFNPGAYGLASQWNDLVGTNSLRYVIEYNAVPEPGPLVLLGTGLALLVVTLPRCRCGTLRRAGRPA